ncbi:PREDICTED: putative cytochrome c oxidase subunit 6b-like [Ipomoea nil]|uniref:putative cytochrome c oxidase subunit 6b-like n=1 Tax=Ipomoea nil TaxID=35883 RepID=UPI000900C155|nr:PREDICTED: putative cytochrome c oxidase subunit 6b-like [Ipomoea nil]
MSAAAPLDPHDKMRGRDVNKVARGEQAPRPVHQPGTVSAPPPPSSTDSKLDAGKKASANAIGERIRHCYIQFLEYKRCIQEKGKDDNECEKIAKEYTSSCPSQWIEKWHEDREQHGR